MMARRTSAPNGGPLRIIKYTRVSTDEQAQHGQSLADQPAMIERCLDQKYGQGGYQVVAELEDPGLSGTLGPSAFDVGDNGRIRPSKRHRPGLTKALEMLLSDEADVLAVLNVSRLYRDGQMGVALADRHLVPLGQDLVSVQEPVDIYTANGMLQLAMMGAAAKYQVASGNDRIRDSLRERKVNRGWLGTPPYGWRWGLPEEQKSPKAKTIVPIPEQLEQVKEVARLYLAGNSEAKVAAALNAMNIPFYMKKTIKGSNISRWSVMNVRILLRNPAHAGLIKLDGELKEGLHYENRAYDREVYDQIQEAIAGRRTRSGRIKNPRPEMVLSGLMHCGACGEKLLARFSGVPPTFTCRGQSGDEGTRHVWVSAETLETAVRHELARLAALPEVLRDAEARIGLEVRRGHEGLRRELEQGRDRLATFEHQKKEALRQLRAELLDESLFKLQMEEIKSEEKIVGERVDELDRQLASVFDIERTEKRALEALRSFGTVWKNLNFDERRELLRTAIERLEVHDRGTHSEMILKLYLMPVVVQPLPNKSAGRIGVQSGVESLTMSELACLRHLAQGSRPGAAAIKMGVKPSTFTTLAKRAARRLGLTDPKKAARQAASWLGRVQHLLPLTGAKGRRRNPKNELTAGERVCSEMREQGFSPDLMAADLKITRARVDKMLASGDAKREIVD